jgi:hypothetical protein
MDQLECKIVAVVIDKGTCTMTLVLEVFLPPFSNMIGIHFMNAWKALIENASPIFQNRWHPLENSRVMQQNYLLDPTRYIGFHVRNLGIF